jgi:GNAT superfamily N-acetyltransferase
MAASLRGLAVEAYEPELIESYIRDAALIEEHATLLVLKSGGRISACGSWTLSDDGHAVVCGVFVDPAASRKGLGHRVMSAIEREAAGHGAGEISVTAPLNAMPFFTSLGFKPSRIVRRKLGDGSAMTAVLMSKTLVARLAAAA